VGERSARNPSLENLVVLVGDWDMDLSGASFLPNPDDKVLGHVGFKWIEGGALLLMRQGEAPPPSPPQARWVIGRDEASPDYKVLYFDGRGVSRIYEMSFGDGLWKLWRNTPDFSQRFEGRLSEDHDTVMAHWEKSLDGESWEHDFNVIYRRRK
jgi:hypothetical protein